jgi:hypothetical protein
MQVDGAIELQAHLRGQFGPHPGVERLACLRGMEHDARAADFLKISTAIDTSFLATPCPRYASSVKTLQM